MNEELKARLEDVVDLKLTNLEVNQEPGSEEHARATNDVVKLAQLLADQEKRDYDYDIEYRKLEAAAENAKAEAEEKEKSHKESWIQFGITSALSVLTTLATMRWYTARYHEGLNFEKEGTYIAKGGAQSIMRNFPKIKF